MCQYVFRMKFFIRVPRAGHEKSVRTRPLWQAAQTQKGALFPLVRGLPAWAGAL